MDSNTGGSVQYDRWNEDIDMNVAASQPATTRFYKKVCEGNSGIAVKTAGALAALVSVYIIGYTTGYYIHRC